MLSLNELMNIIATEALTDEISMPIPRDAHIPNQYYLEKEYRRRVIEYEIREKKETDYLNE